MPNQLSLTSLRSPQPSYDAQYREAKQKLHQYVKEQYKHDPTRAQMLAHKFTQRSFTRHEASILIAQGIPIDPILIEPGLPGGMMIAVADTVLSKAQRIAEQAIKYFIEVLIQGNKREVNEEIMAKKFTARFRMPDGSYEEGTHEGGRKRGGGAGRFLCFCPRYTVVTDGPGTFCSESVNYRGRFINNEFHTLQDPATLEIGHYMRYEGGFHKGYRSGHGKLWVYNDASQDFELAYTGTWEKGVPDTGYYLTADGKRIDVKKGKKLKSEPLEQPPVEPEAPEIPHRAAGIHEHDVAIEMRPPTENPAAPTVKPIQRQLNALPPIAFGKADWEKYFGPICEEPPLPANIDEILQAPCPFWPEKKVHETHLLTLIPTTVNGEPLTLDSLEMWISKPKGGGHLARYSMYEDHVKSEFGGLSLSRPIWVLMTKEVVPHSRGKSFEHQSQLVANVSNAKSIPYQLPRGIVATVSILMHHVKSGEMLFPGKVCTYTRCLEKVDRQQWPIAVGFFANKSIQVISAHINHEPDGVAASRILSDEKAPIELVDPQARTGEVLPSGINLHSNTPAPSYAVFGKADWEKFFGPIGEAPPLPPNIDDILQAPCPIWPNKKVHETHLLTLIPRTVNGQPLNLDTLEQLVQSPKDSGNPSGYTYYNDGVKREHGSDTPSTPYWFLLTKTCLPDSGDKSFEDECKLVNEVSQKTCLPYRLPLAIEAATSILTTFVKTGRRENFSDDPWAFTRCQEGIENGQLRVAVGGLTSKGLYVSHGDFRGIRIGVVGVACGRKL